MSRLTDFNCSLIVSAPRMANDQILDATDALGEAGCTDASICGHAAGMELIFDREADSLQAAIASAISDLERAGFTVLKVEIQRQSIDMQPVARPTRL